MSSGRRKTVLISEVQDIDNRFPFLPYIWATLKSSWERHGEGGDAIEWLDPIWETGEPADLLEPYGSQPIDVLGLSCYTWNSRLQYALAARIKARHPNCLVVAGGPDPDYKDPEFFLRHPYIDVVAVKDGEITFNKILTKVLSGSQDLRDIGGLYLRGSTKGMLPSPSTYGHAFTGPADVPRVFDYSPYIDQGAFFERMVAERGPGAFQAIWETNRGCPYSCSFCDWGSSTMSKVRAFDMTRVAAEAEWFGRMKVRVLFQADANFGILPRDVEIAELLADVRRRHGFPGGMYYSAAKNNPERSVAIAKKLFSVGLARTHALSLQHTRPEVLAATERSNISPEKQVAVVKSLAEDRVPIDVQLIAGIPGDTYALWKGCLSDVMEWGVHEDYQIYTYQLLPNAPAAEASFVSRWKIGTIDRCVTDNVSRKGQEKGRDLTWKAKSRIVVESSTYSREDWVRIFTYSAFVKALHNAGLTQQIAIYLRLTHGVPYLRFYEAVIDEWIRETPGTREMYEAVAAHYQRFLDVEDATEHMAVQDLPRAEYLLDPSRWLYVKFCLELDRFYDSLAGFLAAQFGVDVDGLCAFEKNLTILPTYDRKTGARFSTSHDWVAYFERARGSHGAEALDQPELVPGGLTVDVADQTSWGYFERQLDFGTGDGEDRWTRWIEQVVVGRNSVLQRRFQRLHTTAGYAVST